AGRAGAAGAEGLTLPGLPERRVLRAQVAPEPRDLDWHGKPASCWVIEYFDEELVARTWVRREDSRVLRQEAFERLSGEELVLEREE
ncbi:MAG TPA: hypothetical protein VIL46_15210, partial [Gemmataceae bacterium]